MSQVSSRIGCNYDSHVLALNSLGATREEQGRRLSAGKTVVINQRTSRESTPASLETVRHPARVLHLSHSNCFARSIESLNKPAEPGGTVL